jgi:exonuclease VII large subunit
MTIAANQTEQNIEIAERRIQALEQLIREQPSSFDLKHYEQRLTETKAVLAQLKASLEQPVSATPQTIESLKQKLERVHARLQFADQTLADPETDEHLRGFVDDEQRRLREVISSAQAELQSLDPSATWTPQLEQPELEPFNLELNRAQEEVRCISQLRETLLSWSSRLSLESPQHQQAQERLSRLEISLELANAEVDRLFAMSKDNISQGSER